MTLVTQTTDFEDGTPGPWTVVTAGNGSMTVDPAAAHDGTKGALSSVVTLGQDKASLTQAIGPAQQVTITGWWRVTTEGASGSNVPFARLFYGGQRLVDVYRQNVSGGANVWIRIVKAIGGSNYYYTSTGFRLELNTWAFVELTWGLDGIPTVKINGTTYIDASNKPADWYLAPEINTAWLGSQDTGNPGVWNMDTVTVSWDDGVSATPVTVSAPAITATAGVAVPTASAFRAASTAAPVATASTLARAPGVSASRSAIAAPPALSSTAALPAPAASALRVVLVQSPAMSGSATAPSPIAAAFRTATAFAATALASALLPTPAAGSTLSASVAPPPAAGNAGLLPPTITASRTSTAAPPAAHGSGLFQAPAAEGFVSVSVAVPAMLGSAVAPAPLADAGTGIAVSAPVALAAGLLTPPSLLVGVHATVPVFAAAGALRAPFVGVGDATPPPPTAADIEAVFLPRSDGLAVAFTPIPREWTGLL